MVLENHFYLSDALGSKWVTYNEGGPQPVWLMPLNLLHLWPTVVTVNKT